MRTGRRWNGNVTTLRYDIAFGIVENPARMLSMQPGALPQGAFEQVVTRSKALDMDEVRKQIADQDEQGGAAAAPPG